MLPAAAFISIFEAISVLEESKLQASIRPASSRRRLGVKYALDHPAAGKMPNQLARPWLSAKRLCVPPNGFPPNARPS
jgi:hypothetical protein